MTLTDTAVAIVITALAISSVPPLCRAALVRLPQQEESNREHIRFMLFCERARREIEDYRRPYWSSGEPFQDSRKWPGILKAAHLLKGTDISLLAERGAEQGIAIRKTGEEVVYWYFTERPLSSGREIPEAGENNER